MPEWDLSPGDRIRRRDLHDLFKGGRQGGIAPSRSTPNVLIFSERRSGEQHGYVDRWEGEAFLYVGEGQRGDQEMTHGNKAILEHRADDRALRVFDGARGTVTYKGEFEVDAEHPWEWDTAPETDGGPLRLVIRFRLNPVGSFTEGSRTLRPEEVKPTLRTPYRPAVETPATAQRDPFEVDPDAVDRGLAAHARVQNAVAEHARSRGLEPLSPGLGDPPFDVGWWEGSTFVVVEVKSITPRNEVGQLRLGLGQVLHYAYALAADGRAVQSILAVEHEPSDQRWVPMCSAHGVTLTWGYAPRSS